MKRAQEPAPGRRKRLPHRGKHSACLGLLLLFGCGNLAAASAVADVLARSGRAVERFWEEFAAINCTETVTQMKLGKGGKPEHRREASYDYLVMMRLADEELTFEESRVGLRPAGKEKKQEEEEERILLVTSGFSTLLLIFHPHFQHGFEYSEPEETDLDGKKTLKVNFRHVRGGRTPSCLRLRGRDYPIGWSGSAWIDPAAGTIVRIAAEAGSSLADLGLRRLEADVRYAPVRFAEAPGEQWLPYAASIELRTQRQHWRNIHGFAGYKRFTVSTTTNTEAPR